MKDGLCIMGMIFLPLIGGVIGFLLGKKNKQNRNSWMIFVVVAELLLQGTAGYFMDGGMEFELGMQELLGVRLIFRLDEIRLSMCVLTDLVYVIIIWFMKESMRREKGSNRFSLFLMGTYGMVLGAFLSGSLWVFSMCLSLAALMLYPMVAHRKDEQVLKSGAQYLYMVIGGIVVTQIGLLLDYVHTKTPVYIGELFWTDSMADIQTRMIGALLVLLGMAVFSGLFPVQFMVTKGSAKSMMEASGILASLVSRLGAYGILMLTFSMPLQNRIYGKVLLPAGLLTVFWGLVVTLLSTDIRKILMGIALASNGFSVLCISCGDLEEAFSDYALESSFYMMLSSTLSLVVLYMACLEQVRKCNTFEIKGLIASGKDNRLLGAACLIACASLAGVPGTAGFLAHSTLFHTVQAGLGWKWLIVFYVVEWGFYITAVSRIFMKLFVSKKEETLHILEPEKEQQEEGDPVEQVDYAKHPYLLGECLLLFAGVLQIITGILPGITPHGSGKTALGYVHLAMQDGMVSYYNMGVWIAFAVAALLGILFYVNLVHGVLLRAVRNKKNRELKESRKE